MNGGHIMSDDRPRKEDTAQGEAYSQALSLAAVPEEKRQWHVRWAERFAAFLGDKPLNTADREEAEALMASPFLSPVHPACSHHPLPACTGIP